MLNYGDAVAHLHIARRVFDCHQPRLTQLGSVWLPLPHLLLIPFVQVYSWWASGFAGVIPSAVAYVAGCAGIYRLARQWLPPAAAALTLAFFAANPNLLYLETTAMGEPLFLCETIWIVLLLVEWRTSLDSDPKRAGRLQIWIAVALVAAVLTRYDGWILAMLAWGCVGLVLMRRGARAVSGWRAFWWLPHRWGGSFITPQPSAIGFFSCADLTPPGPSRFEHQCLGFRRIRVGMIRGLR
jgi:hypothetical protein